MAPAEALDDASHFWRRQFVPDQAMHLTRSTPASDHVLDWRQRDSGGWRVDFSEMIKRPSAFLPVAMSFAALAMVLGHVVMFGAVREADEGTAAHVFQLLMVAEVPIVAFFAIKWLPRFPRQTLQVLAVQAAAAIAALAPVFYFNL